MKGKNKRLLLTSAMMAAEMLSGRSRPFRAASEYQVKSEACRSDIHVRLWHRIQVLFSFTAINPPGKITDRHFLVCATQGVIYVYIPYCRVGGWVGESVGEWVAVDESARDLANVSGV